ncbi:nicotinate phosphoribosyltransferase [Spirilliplanes yamanashiensis]|uniref:nicotinate phosphoribosyltransferase n=1 Tax=Spirilliplanes yamanashiensis TaxID=42233 RepID=UPI00194DDD59|nr:nicotinate phosphoribosyltransferase [Spirilliplanes yamanashiensis]MDP9818313.1 nicotinate phosphoribosyltransferase [Spirilliplanes yamanashiensis]
MSGLWTDLYELRMAASYRGREMTAPATFSLFARRLPADRGFLVAAGLADALDVLERYRLDDDELGYLRSAGVLDGRAAALLRGLRFTGDVWAVPEGRVVFADEPLLEVTAPVAEAQLVETALLNVVTFQTAIATKAARCRLAAGGAQLVDFAMRRTHGLPAAMSVARAAAVGGFDATSNVAAARHYDLRPVGTMAHSYVQAFRDERAAFHAFVVDCPQSPVLLIDTYDTIAGARAAIEALSALQPRTGGGVRIDSGDLGRLATQVRRMLDAAGLGRVRIMVSGGLDEHGIETMRGAPVDAFGVGTRMGVSADAPSLDSAYKLVEFAGRPVGKLSPGKATWPGAKQVYRADGAVDLLALRAEPAPPGYRPLLEPVMRGGRVLCPETPAAAVRAARARRAADVAALPPQVRRLCSPAVPAARPTAALTAARNRFVAAHSVRAEIAAGVAATPPR